MSKLPLIGALLACLAAPAYAQYDRPMECWNPRAGHFEQVRQGEHQNDLDYGRCRASNSGYHRDDRPYQRNEGVYRDSDRRYYGAGREAPRECWNPRARSFEAVRPGERQDDLDFARCRALGVAPGGPVYYGGRDAAVQECWNPRMGHFENVREGTIQNDLDYSRCRVR